MEEGSCDRYVPIWERPAPAVAASMPRIENLDSSESFLACLIILLALATLAEQCLLLG